jgi:hypothetical protein
MLSIDTEQDGRIPTAARGLIAALLIFIMIIKEGIFKRGSCP